MMCFFKESIKGLLYQIKIKDVKPLILKLNLYLGKEVLITRLPGNKEFYVNSQVIYSWFNI